LFLIDIDPEKWNLEELAIQVVGPVELYRHQAVLVG
jgi:hypothetical protein